MLMTILLFLFLPLIIVIYIDYKQLALILSILGFIILILKDLRYKKKKNSEHKQTHLIWLNYCRGFGALLLYISAITTTFNLININISNISDLSAPIGPVFLYHGYIYLNSPSNFPSMITIIDLGQSLLLIELGTTKGLKLNLSNTDLIKYGLKRFTQFQFLSIIIFISQNYYQNIIDLTQLIFLNPISLIAWSELIGLIIVLIFRDRKKFAHYIPHIILFIALTLSFIPYFNSIKIYDNKLFLYFPHAMITGIGLFLFGVFNILNTSFKEKVRNIAIYCIIAIIISYFQPLNAMNLNTSLAFFSISVGFILTILFITIEKNKIHLKLFDFFGQNLLTIYLFSLGTSFIFYQLKPFDNPIYNFLQYFLFPLIWGSFFILCLKKIQQLLQNKKRVNQNDAKV